MVHIRLVREEDLKQVYVIEKKCFGKLAYPESLINWFYHLHLETFFVAEADGKVVGYAIGAVIDRRGHIISIAVEPTQQRKGIGTKLLRTLEEALERKGVSKFRLEVRVDNEVAQKFYERQRFRKVSFIERYYQDGSGAFVFEKNKLKFNASMNFT